MKLYRTQEFLEKVKISKRTLEKYEAQGIIKPIRRNGSRLKYYTDKHICDFLGIKYEKKKEKL